ncbi:hypothetical protein M427DRAFT_52445 [Gonapodya prolifera JEL478]|uniref:Microtubule binding protein n=1 Tax=Gonapodya prolifera (strain JEL478) TaxID=1344416 RepID=A0A139AU14_GONPJ|nr:hypothetical protein M427DRAFT_52445 [Gonapodya prolifera JEL478]|eukprot:KXS20194.1 hypothetical protein M427DRAFT_52445 [Gonapodya prolifera JEL478]
MTELSRSELVNWVNDLLQLNYTKIEQLGTGAAYSQILDSIFGDVPVRKCKFDSRQEFEYIANYKVLQETFHKHGIDKNIPVERLVKCKFQDNLEFLQWIKRFWDTHYQGGTYDAPARRAGTPTLPKPASRPSSAQSRPALARSSTASSTGKARATPSPGPMVRQGSASGINGRSRTGTPDSGAGIAAGRVDEWASKFHAAQTQIAALTNQLTELRVQVDGLEKERDFYFGKLRDIEIACSAQIEAGIDSEHDSFIKKLQGILYATEDGFEIPVADGEAEVPEGADAFAGEEAY